MFLLAWHRQTLSTLHMLIYYGFLRAWYILKKGKIVLVIFYLFEYSIYLSISIYTYTYIYIYIHIYIYIYIYKYVYIYIYIRNTKSFCNEILNFSFLQKVMFLLQFGSCQNCIISVNLVREIHQKPCNKSFEHWRTMHLWICYFAPVISQKYIKCTLVHSSKLSLEFPCPSCLDAYLELPSLADSLRWLWL